MFRRLLIGLTFFAAGALIGRAVGPDIKRYVEMKRM